jgi:hypothetical protein
MNKKQMMKDLKSYFQNQLETLEMLERLGEQASLPDYDTDNDGQIVFYTGIFEKDYEEEDYDPSNDQEAMKNAEEARVKD